MAYATILDERQRQGESFEDAIEGLATWAAGERTVDARTAEEIEQARIEREEERVARANAAAFGMIDSALVRSVQRA